ncbi:MAG: serine hydrolase [Desulfobacula sp.]|nr:serine hydrolase [Desulfobacula sp.]
MKTSIKFIITISFLFVLLPLSNELIASSKTEKLDQFFNEKLATGEFNGNVLIALKGKIFYHKSFGIASIDPKKPLHLESQFKLASVSKQFTAMAIMILQERGKLKYDDNIKLYLPELPYDNITIRHLLTHTSGLPDYMELFSYNLDIMGRSVIRENRKIADNVDVINMLVKSKSRGLFLPGEKFQYSNTGYALLATIVSRISKQPFEAFLKKNIFEPLNMSDSLIYSAIRSDQMKHRVNGLSVYRTLENELRYAIKDFHYFDGIAGDHGMYSTTTDLFKWDRALYTAKLVSQLTIKEAFQPVILNDKSTYDYGFGWSIGRSKIGRQWVAHGGGWLGFRTFIVRYIEHDNTIILLVNISKEQQSFLQNIADIIND